VPTLKINHLHGFNQVSGVLFAHVLHTTAFYKPSKETNVIGNYKCTKSVNKNVRFSAKLISDFQNKYKKNY